MWRVLQLVMLTYVSGSTFAQDFQLLEATPAITPEVQSANYFIPWDSRGNELDLIDEVHSSSQPPPFLPASRLSTSAAASHQGILVPWCQNSKAKKVTGIIDVNSYWDTRHFAITTLNLLANLPGDFQYFQFINMESSIDSDSHDWTGFFTEMNLRKAICPTVPLLKPFDWSMQYADGSFPHGVLRLGLRYRFQDAPGWTGRFFRDCLKLTYNVNFHVIETDGAGWQIEHTYLRRFCDGNVYVAGFCDHNVEDNSTNSNWVTEHQIGVRLYDPIYCVAEYRYNSFLPAGQRSGLGVGLEYVIRFN